MGLPRPARLELAVAAQDGRCFWCGQEFSRLVTPTADHLVPRLRGGPSVAENEVACCRPCNARRGHVGPAEWRLRRQEQGWAPPAATVVAALEALLASLGDGGRPRLRAYVDAQLRRL